MRTVLIAAVVFVAAGCGSQKVASKNDTYLTAKEREKYNSSQSRAKTSADLDSREDNFARSSREYDDDYCYSCRVRRYSTGVWYDPWWGPGWGMGWGWGWGWRSWYAPAWGWRPAWDPYWGWGPAYAGPGWYYSPGWGWAYYAGPGWWMTPSSSTSTRRYNYQPRTYTTPRGSTTYKPPRSTVTTPGGNPPRRSATSPYTTPSRPSYSPATPGGVGGARPSIQSGGTGGGSIRSSSPGGGVRPR